jgi:phage terminase large subunit-like protein
LDNEQEVGDPEMWLKANPNIGLTVDWTVYQEDKERAENAPSSRNDILAKRFGIPMEGYTYFFTFEETEPHRKRNYWQMSCSLGADLSQGDDFCAFTFLFPLGRDEYGVKTRSYITTRTFARLPSGPKDLYQKFIDEGSLVVLEGSVLDMMEVYDDLDVFMDDNEYDVSCLGYDPYNAKEFVQRWATEHGEYFI